MTTGGEEAARWSEDVRQVPGEAFHLSTGFSMRITLYCPPREVGEYSMEEPHAHCLCRREDICVTPAVHASPCSRRLLAGGWLVLPQSVWREGCLLRSAPASVRLLADFEFTASSGVNPRTEKLD